MRKPIGLGGPVYKREGYSLPLYRVCEKKSVNADLL